MALAYLFRQSEIKTAIDLGTGSGILALACARLGASKVYALDCNMLAASVTLQNVRLNGLESKIEVLLADRLKVFKNSTDLLVMNLEWPSLCCVLDEEDLSGFRWIVMSGFLHRQFKKLNSRISSIGSIVCFENRDGWTTLLIKSDKSRI